MCVFKFVIGVHIAIFLIFLMICNRINSWEYLSLDFFSLYDLATFNPFHHHQAYLASLPVIIYSNMYEDEVKLKKENRAKAGVYRMVNSLNNKCYIGSSKDLQRRFRDYFNLLLRKTYIWCRKKSDDI